MTRRLRAFHFGEVPSPPATEPMMLCGKPWDVTIVEDLAPAPYGFAFTAPENIESASRAPRLQTPYGEFFLASFNAHSVEPRDGETRGRAMSVVYIGRIVGRTPEVRAFLQALNNSLLQPVEFVAMLGETQWACRRATCTSLGMQFEASGIMIVESLQFTLQGDVLAMA